MTSCARSRPWLFTWLVSIAGIPLAASIAHAATYTVNDTTDAVDSTPGDGICETAPGNAICTLRAAVQEVNAGPGPLDRIELPAGSYALALAGQGEDAADTGDLDVLQNVEIVGAGASATIVDAAGIDRVFDIAPPGSGLAGPIEVSLASLTLRGGQTGIGSDGDGGGVRFTGKLVLQGAVVTMNTADFAGGGVAAAFDPLGILEATELELTDTTVSDNAAIVSDGGGVSSAPAVLSATRSTFQNNTAGGNGGGVAAGTASLAGSLVADNFVNGAGGGLYGQCVDVSASLFTNNRGTTGGAMHVIGPCDSAVVNTTISGNVAQFQGGGLFVGGGVISGPIPRFTLIHATVVNNSLEDAAGGLGAGLFRASGFETKPLEVQNTIVAANLPSNCGGLDVTSLGNNLASDATCTLTEPTDLLGLDPQLGPLAANGGSPDTHALLASSPAIDAAAPIAGISTDQRGFARPIDGDGDGVVASDIGAFEASAVKPPKHHKKWKRFLRKWLRLRHALHHR